MRFNIGKLVITVVVFCAVGVLTAKADGVVGGSWNNWSKGILSSPGTGAYWNNQDPGDGNNANIGWCLAGGGNCALANPPGNIPFLSSGGGSAPSNFYMTNTGASTAGELQLSITNNSSHDFFGWYDTSNPTVLHQLFNGTQTNMTTVFSPSANYGFYFQDQYGYFFTQTSHDSSGSFQAFAIFQQSLDNSYYLGIEDGGPSSDRDYNDMVIHLTSVPEPASMALLGGSLVLMGAFIRRRSRTSANS